MERDPVSNLKASFDDLLHDVALAILSYRGAVDRVLQLFRWDWTEWEATKVEAGRVLSRLMEASRDGGRET